MNRSEALLSVEDVCFSYGSAGEGEVQALVDVSFELGRGELVGLVGQNGSGKTTLARHLNGLLKPGAGRVRVKGRDTREVKPGQLAKTVGYVFQNPDHALFLPTVREEIAYGLQFQQLDRVSRDGRIDEALQAFGLTAIADRHPASFGRGTRRLVVLAAAHAMQPDILVLDEPTGGLDHVLTSRLVETLRAFVCSGCSVVLISHDMQLVANTCQRVLALAGGRLIADCTPAELFRDDAALDRTGLKAPDIARIVHELPGTGIDPDTVSIGGLVEQVRRVAGTDHVGDVQ